MPDTDPKSGSSKHNRALIQRLLKALCLFLLLCLTLFFGVHYWFNHRSQPESANETLFAGITYVRESTKTPRPMVIHVLSVKLDTPGLGFLVTPDDLKQKRPLRARLTSQFLTEFKCQVAVNGDFFFPWHSNGVWDYYPHLGDPVELEGHAWSRGVSYSVGGERAKYPTLYFTKDNHASFKPPKEIYNAISGDFHFLRDNKPVGGGGEYHTKPQPRTVVALDKESRNLIIIVVDGRQPNYSEGATIEDMVSIVRKHGGWDALNLDGGGSTEMVMEKDGKPSVLNSPIDCHVPGRERPVANHLGIFAKPVSP